jgi:hypothetical protein
LADRRRRQAQAVTHPLDFGTCFIDAPAVRRELVEQTLRTQTADGVEIVENGLDLADPRVLLVGHGEHDE